jgi:DNA-binding transcriptional LysR family regulator
MVLTHQGIALGWNHLVTSLVQRGLLVRPIEQQVQLRNSWHYLSCRENSDNEDELQRFREWILGKFPRR